MCTRCPKEITLKRLFDVLSSLVLLSLLAFPLLLLAMLVRLKLGRPVFFQQERIGFDCRPFKMIKFRTMTDKKSPSGGLLPDSERKTDFGEWLRSASLDELPELWNVLRGEMSMVGPRPLLPGYLKLYSAEQLRRHEVRPGITGWAQVNGRNRITWDEKFRLDVWYVDNYNLLLDNKIILCTIKKIVTKEGVNTNENTTMPPFTGTIDPGVSSKSEIDVRR